MAQSGLTSVTRCGTMGAQRPYLSFGGAAGVQRGDSDFIASFLAGDADAVRQVDQWILQSAQGFRQSLAQDWDDAVQEIHLEVLGLLRKGQFRGEANLKTYLWRVVSHSCLDRLRARRKWQWSELEDAPEMEALAVERSQRRVGWTESKELTMRVLEEASKECRRLWAMVFSGLSYREMSQKLQVSEGTLRVRVLRCRKRAIKIRSQYLSTSGTG